MRRAVPAGASVGSFRYPGCSCTIRAQTASSTFGRSFLRKPIMRRPRVDREDNPAPGKTTINGRDKRGERSCTLTAADRLTKAGAIREQKNNVKNGLDLRFAIRQPRCSDWASSCSLTQSCQPSPKRLSGRPAHRPFRGLLSVHSRCGLHTRTVTNVVTAIRRLQTFRLLHACSGCFRLEHLAGRDLHPLESAAFSRRTPSTVIRWSGSVHEPYPRAPPRDH